MVVCCGVLSGAVSENCGYGCVRVGCKREAEVWWGGGEEGLGEEKCERRSGKWEWLVWCRFMARALARCYDGWDCLTRLIALSTGRSDLVALAPRLQTVPAPEIEAGRGEVRPGEEGRGGNGGGIEETGEMGKWEKWRNWGKWGKMGEDWRRR